jgi:O-antigen/teichoic acid export membrane protein
MVALALATRPLLPWIAENFAAAGWLFVLCTIDVALFLVARPIESACHGLRRPRLELWLRAARLPVLLALALLLVPAYGALGMASAHIATAVAGLLLAAWTIRRALGAGDTSQPSRRATRL